jgi:hypothetical protein
MWQLRLCSKPHASVVSQRTHLYGSQQPRYSMNSTNNVFARYKITSYMTCYRHAEVTESS